MGTTDSSILNLQNGNFEHSFSQEQSHAAKQEYLSLRILSFVVVNFQAIRKQWFSYFWSWWMVILMYFYQQIPIQLSK